MKVTGILSQGLKLIHFLFSYIGKNNICKHSPIIMMIEPTNYCNIKCSMCFRNDLSRKKGFLSLDLHNQLIDNNKHIKRIVYCGSGEPLLHPQLDKMIGYASKRGITTEINTNGILMDKKLAESIIFSNLHNVVFSFEGLIKEDYEKIRKGADFSEVEGNIKNFIKLKNFHHRKNLSVNVDCVDFNYSRRRKKIFKKRILSYGVNNVNFLPYHQWPSDDKSKIPKSKKQKYYGCILPWLMINVLWDGKVVACCDDFDGKNIIGDLNHTISVYKVWNGRAMCNLRNKLSNNKINDVICGGCHRITKNPWKYPFLNRIKREIKENFIQ